MVRCACAETDGGVAGVCVCACAVPTTSVAAKSDITAIREQIIDISFILMAQRGSEPLGNE
jgi:hypothetical protein